MKQEIAIFENSEFGKLRTVAINGEPWFVAADVCRALEHSNPTKALGRLDEDEKANFKLGLQGGGTNCVSESGLYSLVLGSRKPEAKAFKRWITHEVIPCIRKNGAYMTAQTIEAIMSDPQNFLKLVEALAVEKQKNSVLENALTVSEANNEELRTANKALAIQINTWDDRRVTVALMRAYGTFVYGGTSVAWAWYQLYKALESKLGINVKIRRGRAQTSTRPLLDYIRPEEWQKVVSVAAAMCEAEGMNIGAIIGKENAKRLDEIKAKFGRVAQIQKII